MPSSISKALTGSQLTQRVTLFIANGAIKVIYHVLKYALELATREGELLYHGGRSAMRVVREHLGRAVHRLAALCGKKRKFEEVDDEEKQSAVPNTATDYAAPSSASLFGRHTYKAGQEAPKQAKLVLPIYYPFRSGSTHQNGTFTSFIDISYSGYRYDWTFFQHCYDNLQELGAVTYTDISGGATFEVTPSHPDPKLSSNER